MEYYLVKQDTPNNNSSFHLLKTEKDLSDMVVIGTSPDPESLADKVYGNIPSGTNLKTIKEPKTRRENGQENLYKPVSDIEIHTFIEEYVLGKLG